MDVIILVSLPLINCIKILQTNGSSGLLELQLRGRGGGFGGMVFCPKPYGLGVICFFISFTVQKCFNLNGLGPRLWGMQ